jgi:periplasmic protein CpxP/Spy
MKATRIFGATPIVAAIALCAPIALAQQQMTPAAPAASPPAASAPSSTASKPSRSARVETRIKQLHSQLKITPDQEQAWDAVASVMRDSAANIDQLSQQRTEGRSTMSALDNLKSYQSIADAHADEMNKLVPAFEALYDKMTPAQQKNADMVFRPRTARHTTATKKSG